MNKLVIKTTAGRKITETAFNDNKESIEYVTVGTFPIKWQFEINGKIYIIETRRDDWICYQKDNNSIWECGKDAKDAYNKMTERIVNDATH